MACYNKDFCCLTEPDGDEPFVKGSDGGVGDYVQGRYKTSEACFCAAYFCLQEA